MKHVKTKGTNDVSMEQAVIYGELRLHESSNIVLRRKTVKMENNLLVVMTW